MAFDWYKKLSGFVEIEIDGYFSERFINLALNRGITIWNIRNDNSGRKIAKIVPKDFKKIRQIAHKTGCRIKIIKKKGLPFIAFKYKKRKIFVLLVILTTITIYIYNSFIWSIDIEGDFDIPIEELREQLEEENLKIMTRKEDIDIDKLKINMALKRNDLAWIGVNIKGTKATVEIVEKVMPKVEVLDGVPCNVVASKDGIITKIYAKDGLAIVEKGDMVQKGQILISGIMTSELFGSRYVHADGEVYAKTWYTNKVKVPYIKDTVGKSGNTEKRYKIKFGNYEINFLNYDTKFEKYDTITSEMQLKIFNKFILPIKVEQINYEELTIDSIELTKEQAEGTAKNEAMCGAMENIPSSSEIVNNSVVVREYADGVEAEVIIECIEKIGTKEKLGG